MSVHRPSRPNHGQARSKLGCGHRRCSNCRPPIRPAHSSLIPNSPSDGVPPAPPEADEPSSGRQQSQAGNRQLRPCWAPRPPQPIAGHDVHRRYTRLGCGRGRGGCGRGRGRGRGRRGGYGHRGSAGRVVLRVWVLAPALGSGRVDDRPYGVGGNVHRDDEWRRAEPNAQVLRVAAADWARDSLCGVVLLDGGAAPACAKLAETNVSPAVEGGR